MPDFEAQKAENDALVFQDELEGRAVPLGLPRWIGLHTTSACNLKCIFCLQADGLQPVVPMGEEVFVRAAEQLFPTARVAQLTASGEPLMTPQLGKVLDVFHHFGVRLDLITNATLLKDRAVLRRAFELADTFTFSVDGATRETFNRIRIGADFDQVMDNIRFWNRLRLARPRGERPRMSFNFILMKDTIREVEAMVEIAHAFRADILSIFHLSEHRDEVRGQSLHHHRTESNHYLGGARRRAHELGVFLDAPQDFVLSPEEREADARMTWPAPQGPDPLLLRRLAEDVPAGADPGGADLARWPDFPPLPDGSVRCHFLWRRTYVAPYGDVYTCCHPDAEAMGNLVATPFRTLWTGPRYAEYRRTVYGPKPIPVCDGCFIIGRSGRAYAAAKEV